MRHAHLLGADGVVLGRYCRAYREAQVQAFADAYLVIAICLAASAIMVPLMCKITPEQAP